MSLVLKPIPPSSKALSIGLLDLAAELKLRWGHLLESSGYRLAVRRDVASQFRNRGRKHCDFLLIGGRDPAGMLQAIINIREHLGWAVPILCVVERASNTLVEHALDVGADDCVTWPCSDALFLARVNALIRRTARYDSPGPS
ncbi:hypothetical protein [Burkholderia ubonensis]|uniref:hypothetical protein n=1 Tax=Burkholderia ubonensis TaxID=101571 RepID=UPI0012F7233F|nr:hypothetical protein [Burkholderia ubonensis]